MGGNESAPPGVSTCGSSVPGPQCLVASSPEGRNVSASRLYARGLVAAAIVSFFGSGAAFAALPASATISTPQTSAPFNYTITLNNTGTTDIGTFWFAWTSTPSTYDFLPTTPTN